MTVAGVTSRIGGLLVLVSSCQAFIRPTALRSCTGAPRTMQMSAAVMDDRKAAVPELMDWAFKNGVVKKDTKVTIGPSSNGLGLGLIAASNIRSGDALAIVPMPLCLSVENSKLGALGKVVTQWEPLAGEASIIALQLLYERSQGTKSKYAAYLKTLPSGPADGFDHPLFWSLDELDLLSKSSTRDVRELVSNVAEDFMWVQANVLAPKVAGLGADSVSFDDFNWAVAIVLSRSFYVDNALRLAPLLDMGNRGENRYNEAGSTGMGIFGGKGIRVAADRDYKEGDEVLISYGPKSGIEFLEDHGFVPPRKPEDASCEMCFEITEEDDRFWYDKEDILRVYEMGLKRCFDLNAAGDMDPEMLQFLRLYNLKDKDAFLLEAVFRQEVWGFMQLPISEANEEAVGNMVASRCAATLEKFEQADAMAEQLAKDGKAKPERLAMMASIRAGERIALEAAKAWAERDLTTLDIKEYYQERRLKELQLCGPLTDDEMADATGGRRSRDLDW